MRYQVVLATRNLHKVKEIRQLLQGLDLDLATLADYPAATEVIEDGKTLEQNALKKARVIADYTGCLALADDTGLEVDCLGGQPGVYSSRYSGEGASYADNVEKLLQEMRGVPWNERTARFRCVAALVGKEQKRTIEGSCEGVICEEPRGHGGFGYDPVFYVPEKACTFAEMDLTVKNRISHRAKAFLAVRDLFERGEVQLS